MCSTARSCVSVSVVTGIRLPGGCLSAAFERLRVTWDSWSRQGTTAESLSDSPLLQQSHENHGLGISTIFYAESCGQVMAKVCKSMCKFWFCVPTSVGWGPLWLLMFLSGMSSCVMLVGASTAWSSSQPGYQAVKNSSGFTFRSAKTRCEYTAGDPFLGDKCLCMLGSGISWLYFSVAKLPLY